eukprot:gene5912-33485_t
MHPLGYTGPQPSDTIEPNTVLSDMGQTDQENTIKVRCQAARMSALDQIALLANILASVFSALVTALVESPVELFRHNQQASNRVVAGGFLREMVTTVRAEGSCGFILGLPASSFEAWPHDVSELLEVTTVRAEGPAGLYWGFLPHLFEAWPHDVSELLVVGAMSDFRADSTNPSSKHHACMQHVPHSAWDLGVGAVSAAVAVLVSMPFDCIKTYMQTHGTNLEGKGLIHSAFLFVGIGCSMLMQQGI